MANGLAEAREGLVAMLRRIEGLSAHSYVSPARLREISPNGEWFPAAIVRPEYREGADSGLFGGFVVEALVSGGSVWDASIMLEAFLEPEGALSIESAVVGVDDTWCGKVSSSRLMRVDNIGARMLDGDEVVVGADFHFWFEGR